MRDFPNKRAALAHMKSLGYVHHQTGQCGDGPWGSREYWMKPGCEINQHGWPLDTMCASRLTGKWVVS